MALPPSAVRIRTSGVEYTSNVDRAQYLITELERAALRDAGKFLRISAKQKVPVNTGDAKKSVATWVKKQQGDKSAHLQIGFYNKKTANKKGLKYVGYAHLIEFGSVKQPALRPLSLAVTENVNQVRQIIAQYLGDLSGPEGTAIGRIDVDEEVEDS